MIKRAGINISPAEVEDVLVQHPGIQQAAVVGVPDRERGELVIAFVVACEGADLTAEEIILHCRSVASKYKVPDRIELSAELPVTTTGKLQRRELKRLATERFSGAGNG
jgi:acyl-coenzyme A synthetase/AMP-(fatty) acid ligase